MSMLSLKWWESITNVEILAWLALFWPMFLILFLKGCFHEFPSNLLWPRVNEFWTFFVEIWLALRLCMFDEDVCLLFVFRYAYIHTYLYVTMPVPIPTKAGARATASTLVTMMQAFTTTLICEHKRYSTKPSTVSNPILLTTAIGRVCLDMRAQAVLHQTLYCWQLQFDVLTIGLSIWARVAAQDTAHLIYIYIYIYQ